MAVHRIHKTKDYTVMSNTIFKDKRLSYKAKGLHALMMSLPDYWDYSTEGLVTLSTDGNSSVRSALQELENCGYLVRTRLKDDSGKFTDVVYDIYEIPQDGKPHVENPHVENRTQLNTNKSNTNKSKHRGFIAPTLDECKTYADERALVIDVDYFYKFFTDGNWIDTNGKKVLNWKQKMLTWNKKELEKHPEKAEKLVYV